jgi:MFS family permease
VETRPRPTPSRDPWWPSFVAGLRYLRREPRLRAATTAAAVWNLTFVPMEALLVLFATESLGIPDRDVGWYFGAQALVGASGVLLAPRVTRLIGLGRTFVVGMALLGGGFMTLAVAANAIAALSPVWSIVAATFPAGLAITGVSLANVAFFTLRQQLPPPEMRGRVIAASRTLAWAFLPIGASVGGVLGDAVGVRPVYLGASLLLLVVAALLVLTALWHHREPGSETASG